MIVKVRVIPNAEDNEIVSRMGSVLRVRVTAPAVDGRANEATTEALSSALGVRRSSVRIVSGHSNRTKVVEVTDLDVSAVERLLAL